MLPIEFCERMKNTLGEDYERFEATFEREPFRGLRANTLKINRDGRTAAEIFAVAFQGVEAASSEVDTEGTSARFITGSGDGARDGLGECTENKSVPVIEKVSWAENGYYYANETAPGKHPYHEAGVYYIQEPSAMAPVGMLQPVPGERVLDLCAAPGGKSSQLAALLRGEGILVSNEINPQRARILSENMERMGVKNAIVTNETAGHLAEYFPGYFDRILVDAPCSGEGMFRKNEEAVSEWSPENVLACAQRQDEILDDAAQMLRAGGTLVYSTCTFAPEEDEGSIARFLERHPEFECLEQRRLWPHEVNGEGHFAAKLVKAGGDISIETVNAEPNRIAPLAGFMPGEKYKALKEFCEFAQESFLPEVVEQWKTFGQNSSSQMGPVFSFFGDSLYLMPEGTPILKGLKIMRPGLQLGIYKKNRFEPSHALALAMDPQKVQHFMDVNSLQEAERYLDGMTLNVQGDKGWYVIGVDGYSLGWGKLAGGIMKNHYPKGLRK